MKQNYFRKITAFVMAMALLFSGSCALALQYNTTAYAASKKVVLSLSPAKLSINVGDSKKLTIKKTNVKSIKSKEWTSGKKNVATISKKGVVTAKKAGKATIKCKVGYVAKGSSTVKNKTLKCVVTVKGQDVTPVPEETQAPAPEETPAPVPTSSVNPDTPLSDILDANDITLRVESNNTSNIGEEREISIAGSTSGTMKVKDNGTMRKELSSQYLADHEMGLGVNLGNTMEAALPIADKNKQTEVSAFEQAWSQPVTTEKYFDCLASYGINTVRIPVAWSNMDADDGTYTINEKYLARVEEIVNYALNRGMYVIINDHWDNGWWGQFGAAQYDESGKKVADEKVRANAWKRYETYWMQIANRFKNYSDHLIFEGANEELGSRLNDRIYSNGYSASADEKDTAIPGNLTKDEQYQTTNAINQKFVDIVRSTGGNNESRHLLIPGFNTDIENTADERFIMPSDPSNPDVNKLFLSVHYYTPWAFCGDNSTGSYSVGDQEETKRIFANLKRFSDAGYAVIVGECGVVNPTGVESSVSQWLYDTFAESAKYHAVPCLWETSQYFDRVNAQMRFKDIAVLYNTITGANGDTNISRVSGKVEISDIVEINGQKPVWSWTGKWYKNGGDNTIGDDKFEENGGTVVTKTDSTTKDDLLAKFVPQSEVTSTISGDTTSISFNEWGYQAFIKMDVSKYKLPAISFDFLEGTDTEDNVMGLIYGASTDASVSGGITVDYGKYHGKAVVITEECGYSAEKPYIYVTFGGKPIVTGIHIYEMGI